MSEFQCPLVYVEKLEKHANADALSIYNHHEYPVVVKTEEFLTGTLAVYFPVDAVLPNKPVFSFMWKGMAYPNDTQRRVKACRLRGVFSMGLLIPLNKIMEDFPELKKDLLIPGDDLAKDLGVYKYEPPEDTNTGGNNAPLYPWFVGYTDIENARKYANKVLVQGENVILTEKIHGCVSNRTLIRMADGTNRNIRNIQVGDLVMGRNEEGEITPSRITNIFNNGKLQNKQKWINIRVQKIGMNRGNSYSSLYCTNNHKIFRVKDNNKPNIIEEVDADQLQVGDYVTLYGWLPKSDKIYKPQIKSLQITEISDADVVSDRYDIETETHNYFASDILVHNSNARFLYRQIGDKGDGFWLGSRNFAKQIDDNNVWAVVAKKLDIENKLKQAPNLIIFGEVYGNTQKGFGYDSPGQSSFIAFDVYDTLDNRYLDYYEAKIIAENLGFRWVPEIYTGPWTCLNDFLPYAEGGTILGEGTHVREGFVLKPEKERWDHKLGRVVVKIHGEGFLTGKKK